MFRKSYKLGETTSLVMKESGGTCSQEKPVEEKEGERILKATFKKQIPN